MILYNRSVDHDLMLEAWYHTMRRSGDLEVTFLKRAHSLSVFYSCFAPPNELVFAVDEQGVYFAMWFEPTMNAAMAGLWIAPHKRHSVATYKLLRQTLASALATWPLILGITKQERLLAPHERLGYHIYGKLRTIWDGEDAWLVGLTQEGLDHGRTKSGRHRRQREARERERTSLAPHQ